MPPFWFRRRRKKKSANIRPLRGSPFSNIPRWLYERKKRIRTNPLNRGESTTTKDKKINIKNLQKLLKGVISTVNQLIKEINRIPALERRMDAHEKANKKHFNMMKKYIAKVELLSKDTDALLLLTKSRRGHKHSVTSAPGMTGAGYKKGGILEEGGPVQKKQTPSIVDWIDIEFGGNRPDNVLQDFTFDQDGRIYTTHDPSSGSPNDDAAVISKLTPRGELCPHDDWCLEGAGSHDGIVTPPNGWKGFGHGQGLSYEEIPGSAVDKLWATCYNCPEGYGDRGTAYRFSREWMGYNGCNGNCEPRQEYQLFDSNDYEKLMVSLSPSQNYLVASAKHMSDNVYHIKIFEHQSGNLTEILEPFPIDAPTSFQGIAIDDNKIYCSFGNNNPNHDKHLYIYDFNGNQLDHIIHTIGKDWAIGIHNFYEPEGLAFKGNQLYIGIVAGDNPSGPEGRLKRLYPVMFESSTNDNQTMSSSKPKKIRTKPVPYRRD